jgi:hypothetical protein
LALKKEEEAEECVYLHNDELHYFYSSSHIIKVSKSTQMRSKELVTLKVQEDRKRREGGLLEDLCIHVGGRMSLRLMWKEQSVRDVGWIHLVQDTVR